MSTDLKSLIEEALRAHQAGQLDDAIRHYRRILEFAPDYVLKVIDARARTASGYVLRPGQPGMAPYYACSAGEEGA